MKFYIALSIGFILGFLLCAIFASTKIAKLERFIAKLLEE
jgi:hypothetical protein